MQRSRLSLPLVGLPLSAALLCECFTKHSTVVVTMTIASTTTTSSNSNISNTQQQQQWQLWLQAARPFAPLLPLFPFSSCPFLPSLCVPGYGHILLRAAFDLLVCHHASSLSVCLDDVACCCMPHAFCSAFLPRHNIVYVVVVVSMCNIFIIIILCCRQPSGDFTLPQSLLLLLLLLLRLVVLVLFMHY